MKTNLPRHITSPMRCLRRDGSAVCRLSVRSRHVFRCVTAVAVLCVASTASAQTERTRAERLQFDPVTGQWRTIAAPIPGTEAGDLELARVLLAKGEFAKARSAFASWRKAHPDSEFTPEGLFYSADTEVLSMEATGQGDLRQAYRWYEELLDNWAGNELTERAMRREMLIAEMYLFKGKKQYLLKGLIRVSATDEGLKILSRIADERAPNTLLAENALRLTAEYHYLAGEYSEAEVAYARLARDFPRGRYERLALLRSADAAMAAFPGVRFDESSLLEAQERYRRYQDKYGAAATAEGVPELLIRIKESLAQKEYLIGRYYERTYSPRAAAFYYRYVLSTYSDTTVSSEARLHLATVEALIRSAGDHTDDPIDGPDAPSVDEQVAPDVDEAEMDGANEDAGDPSAPQPANKG